MGGWGLDHDGGDDDAGIRKKLEVGFIDVEIIRVCYVIDNMICKVERRTWGGDPDMLHDGFVGLYV